MTSHDTEVTIKYCRDCQEVVEDRTSSWLCVGRAGAEAKAKQEMDACISFLVKGKGCKATIRPYKGQ